MARLAAHVLDTATGGVRITLHRNLGERYALVRDAVINSDGRCDAPKLEGAALTAGGNRLVHDFGITGAAAHCHVPLLVSPWSCSTYRGN